MPGLGTAWKLVKQFPHRAGFLDLETRTGCTRGRRDTVDIAWGRLSTPGVTEWRYPQSRNSPSSPRYSQVSVKFTLTASSR